MASGTLIDPYNTTTAQSSFRFWGAPVYTASNGTLWCPGFDGATFSTSPYDYVTVAVPYGPNVGGAPPNRTPGVCIVDVRKEYAVDKKKPLGSNGARVTFHGIDAAEVNIEIKIWTPEQLRQLELMWSSLFPPANKGVPVAFDVGHPILNDVHGVKSVQFVSGSGPIIQGDRTGIFRIRALEYQPPATTNVTKTQVKSIGSLLDAPTYSTPGSNTANLAPR